MQHDQWRTQDFSGNRGEGGGGILANILPIMEWQVAILWFGLAINQK